VTLFEFMNGSPALTVVIIVVAGMTIVGVCEAVMKKKG